ncbi:unnamed protein product [Peronospora farinosa]|uniref:RxLR effector protein n=1 Tax=Peronospora farinosa TaxID=134698 RepID=A0AAV0TRR1_9STRA|nr:unnamed protein product [Peronospora farinosa]CAI5724773.1 unnamed protein product [Peronospora farinosa]
MPTGFFPIMFVIAIVASKIQSDVAETNPSGRLHVKDDDTASHLRSADALDNSIGIKENERGFFARFRPKTTVSPVRDEAVMKEVNTFMAEGKASTKLKKENVRAIATYATRSSSNWGRATNIVYNLYGISMVAFFFIAILFFGWRSSFTV